MKRIILILAVLTLAVPAGAEVLITCSQDPWCFPGSKDYNLVTVTYDATSETNNVRALALNIELTDTIGADNAVITGVEGYHVGENNSVQKGFGIFPGTITIDGAGNVTNWGTPVAPNTAPGAAGSGLNTKKIVVEMGSLYTDANAPPKSGTLLKFRFNHKVATVTITENTERGGIVMENPDEPVDLNAPVLAILCPADICGKGYKARDAKIDSWDVARLGANYGKSPLLDPRADITGKGYKTYDGTCNSWDVGQLGAAWAAGPLNWQ
jgi:hypothetical protein